MQPKAKLLTPNATHTNYPIINFNVLPFGDPQRRHSVEPQSHQDELKIGSVDVFVRPLDMRIMGTRCYRQNLMPNPRN